MVKLESSTQQKYLYSFLRERGDVHRALKTDNSSSLCLYWVLMGVFWQNGLKQERLERRQLQWKGTGGPVKENPEKPTAANLFSSSCLGALDQGSLWFLTSHLPPPELPSSRLLLLHHLEPALSPFCLLPNLSPPLSWLFLSSLVTTLPKRAGSLFSTPRCFTSSVDCPY